MTALRKNKIHIVTLVIPLLFFACHSDTDITVVDFSKTVAVNQPDDPRSQTTGFRVAVGAMISPRETVVHYHQLLDYLAGNMDKSIHMVQRKTYGEINKLIGTGKMLKVGRQEITQLVHACRESISSLKPQEKSASEVLYDLLIQPIKAELNKTGRVYLTLHGILHHLPFQVLSKNGHYLMED